MVDSPTGPYGALIINGLPSSAGVEALALNQVTKANDYLVTLGVASSALVPPVITPVFPAGGVAPLPVTLPQPNFSTVVWTAPGLPDQFNQTLNTNNIMPAPFDTAPPVLSFGSAPVPFSDTAPTAPGVDLNFAYPADLTVALPAPPNLLSLNTINFAGINMPTIDYTLPVLTAVAPSVIAYTPGALYTSSLLTQLKTTMQYRIQYGGTGLPAAVETAIWNRGREREAKSMADSVAALQRMEDLGFAFPPGVYMDARIKIETEYGYVSAGISREVMIKQAELELENILKALDTSVALEGKLIDYTNSVEQRLFEAAKYATEAGIAIYNSQVQAYSAYLDAYKTKVQIYTALVQGEIAKVDAYKAQISAEEAKAQINTALVQQYKVGADVALSSIEVYKAQISAIQIKAEIEKTKVEVFGEQVKAYSAKIGAYSAGVEAFRATIQAEATKQEAFKSSVEAYSAQVDAAVKQIEARIKEFEGLIEAKNSQWEGYKAAIAGEASKAQAVAATNQVIAEAFKAQILGINAYNEVLVKEWQVALDQAQRVSEIGVSAAKANAELFMTTRSLALDAAKVGAQVSAQLGASALGAVNFSTHISDSISNSFSEGQTYSYNVNQDFSASV